MRQRQDKNSRIEWTLWNINLGVFFLALTVLLASLLCGLTVWSVLALATMLVTFITGALYAKFAPKTHLREFQQALQHGEVVLMVDAHKKRGFEIEEWVRLRHLEAGIGGIGWGLDALGI